VALKALLFDFDGTLVDTERPSFRTWQEIYEEHGHELALERWVERVGTIGGFDPLEHLASLVHREIDRETIAQRRIRRRDALIEVELLRAGVPDYLEQARRRRLKVGIVTSGPTEWVARHLERLRAAEGWDCIVCADHDASVAKPRPTLYLRALDRLGVEADEAAAIEDSPNGIRAAKAAGVFCVAVPNAVTAALDLSAADLVVASLVELPLADLVSLVERR
jgi:HAD superfamily hydrolase (TIGR01509 family)